jgi:hypothetical protein
MSKNFVSHTIQKLQRIRRANNGIRGCAEILAEHSINSEGMLVRPGANILLTSQQEIGLLYVIEACSDMIDELFYDFEKKGVNWSDEHLPQVRKDCEIHSSYLREDISFEEFKEKTGMDPSIQ